ncbi:hypothetical protein LTR86_005305 [Recurvomyces mirabilis]|nr:hypothetical protein LTR86_005305 [Recurvomyces mirabilis]
MAYNNGNGNSTKPKLTIKHVFDPAARKEVVFSTLAPVFNMDNAAMQMMKPDFMRALHHSASAGVVDVMPVSEKGERIEMTMAIEGGTGKVLQQAEVWVEGVEKVVL